MYRRAIGGWVRLPNTDPTRGLIVSTSTACRIAGRSWEGIPTIVWPDGIDLAASDWLRALVVEQGVAISSAFEYAKVLRPFLRFCRSRSRNWETVDDEFLIIWREFQRRTRKASTKRVNASLKTVFAFYRWAEETKRIRFRVGIYTPDELPRAMNHTTFPISAKKHGSKDRNGRVFGSWTTPLTLSDTVGGGHYRHTPSEREIRELHEVAAERVHGVRDSLMLSWAEEVGARRAEFMRIRKSHLPSTDQLSGLIERDERWSILIERKGGRTKPLYVLPDLIIRTMDYIQFERREVVLDLQKRIVGYREPDELFLSGKTGLPLHLDSVTSIGGKIFARAGVEKANIHRLRARHAVRTIETLVDAIFNGAEIGAESSWVETILTKAAEELGHTNSRSLRPYLTYVLNRRIQSSDASKAERLASRIRQLSLHEESLIRRLKHQTDLQRLSEHIQSGRDAEAATMLKMLTEQFK
ncbi:site-specific tyrosine recombinase XerC [Roseovarius sp. THAF9]|nr:site-specific tyrosine recombinase XerC [Roseovarius sp. THAF9]